MKLEVRQIPYPTCNDTDLHATELEASTKMFGQLADPNGANHALSQVLYGLALRYLHPLLPFQYNHTNQYTDTVGAAPKIPRAQSPISPPQPPTPQA